ncbi:MAG: peptide/nickel transport system substrate-binding protein [Acetobacteraceae bacterium]|jgi:peptide/nickel transport system substrate-binding protein|nr:transporter substrate-binding protein [Rhodopila sp.]MEA2733261.1 peptide/nickel transport system substrate-binding protein [Acetobacteraceae bacterium]MEA2772487.1 peptide/nickel transport system substrate-binding protein [Acetobacteraceae bacterium]
MKRRNVLKSAAAISATLAAPRIGRADGPKTVTFAPHADLASIDPVWTTADITRNYSLAVFDTLYGYDAQFQVQPQMVEGHRVEDDGKTWELTLRDGLAFHDGQKVLARDCVATIKRFAIRNPFGQALMKRVAEVSAPSDSVIRFRLNKPFPLLPNALAEVYCAIMPSRLAETDAMKQIPEAIGSGPFKFMADERIPGSRVVFSKNDAYVPRKSGTPSFNAGPKIVNVDRVVWTFIPDPATVSAALQQGEIDWWENPSLDLIPQIKTYKDVTLAVKDRTGEMGCLRFNHLFPPFDNVAIRRIVVAAIDQKEVMEAVSGAAPSLYKTDVGIFVPGTPMASTVGVEITRGPKNYAKLKQDLAAAGYNGEKIVILAATTIPTIWAEAQVASDMLTKIGFNVDLQSMEWGSVVQRRASREPPDKGGWNIFYTWLGGFGNISPAPSISIRGNGTAAWFGWPTNEKIEELYSAWFEAPGQAEQQKICEAMQVAFWQNPTYAPLGMYDQPTAFHTYMRDVPDGWPQFYGLKKAI